jgi:hypothetical protein
MKKILATILMLGFVVPVFAKVQKPQTNNEKLELIRSIDTSLRKISKHPRKTYVISKPKAFVSGLIIGAVGMFITLIIKSSIFMMHHKKG